MRAGERGGGSAQNDAVRAAANARPSPARKAGCSGAALRPLHSRTTPPSGTGAASRCACAVAQPCEAEESSFRKSLPPVRDAPGLAETPPVAMGNSTAGRPRRRKRRACALFCKPALKLQHCPLESDWVRNEPTRKRAGRTEGTSAARSAACQYCEEASRQSLAFAPYGRRAQASQTLVRNTRFSGSIRVLSAFLRSTRSPIGFVSVCVGGLLCTIPALPNG